MTRPVNEDVRLTTEHVEQMVQGLKFAIDGMAWLSATLQAFILALEEVQRVRDCLKHNKKVVSWDDFLGQLTDIDYEFSRALRRATAEKFSLGQLYLKAGDSITHSTLLILKDRLHKFLTDLYGANFKVRILPPEGA